MHNFGIGGAKSKILVSRIGAINGGGKKFLADQEADIPHSNLTNCI